MCTVTYIPQENGYCLTSSRDEDTSRTCLPPERYLIGDKTIIFPKDQLAKGSWIAATTEGRAACLLNGAFKMDPLASYPRSRGLILLESFQYEDALAFAKSVNLEDVGPFTLLLLDFKENTSGTLLELRWDGERKYLSSLDTQSPYIWSSVTLYDTAAADKRKEWFRQWLTKKDGTTAEGVFNFHNKKHGNDPATDILMQRLDFFKTVSISQIQWYCDRKLFSYHDLITQKHYLNQLHVPKSISELRLSRGIKSSAKHHNFLS